MNSVQLFFLIVFGGIILVVAISTFFKIRKNLKKIGVLGKKNKPIKPTIEVENDKIVIIKATQKEISEAITEFLKLYNSEEYLALPRLHVVSDDTYVVTFPYDISFEIFCYFLNFMYYPTESEKDLDVYGWATTPVKDDFVLDEYANTKGMFFIPVDDEDYDNVFMTTEDGKGYKIDFGGGKYLKKLSELKHEYKNPQYTLSDLENLPFKDLK